MSAKEQQAQNQCIYDLSHDLIKSRREIAQQKALIKEMIAYAKRTLTFWFADDKHTVGKRLLFMAGQEPTTPNQEQGTQLAKFFEQLRLEEEKPNATHQQ